MSSLRRLVSPFCRFSQFRLFSVDLKTIKVRYGQEVASFKVPSTYTVSQLLQDSSKHWNKSESNLVLGDFSGNIWPQSLSVDFLGSDVELKLKEAATPRNIAPPQSQNDLEEDVDVVYEGILSPGDFLKLLLRRRPFRQELWRSPDIPDQIKKNYYRLITPFVTRMIETKALADILEDRREARARNPSPKVLHRVVELFTDFIDQEQQSLENLQQELLEPHLWYPEARAMKRKVIVHYGPTNSGKTHHALSRLANSKSGMYGGPLRLLALEVYEKMVAKDVPCNLLTGQEKIIDPTANHTASTVELVDLTRPVEVAVLDEMQMMANKERGHAWTRAFLGLQAEEIHICGDPSMVGLVEELCELTGDTIELKKYERLTKLKLSPALQSWSAVQRGDCVVAFSRRSLYAIKEKIQQTLGLKCCIVYGSLPPEVRRKQAQLYNDENSDYDVLVASDAVGMGLNFQIRRMVFSETRKFDGEKTRRLTTSEVLQIAGRAGRYKSKYPTGYVTVLESGDESFLKKRLSSKLEPITASGLFPEWSQISALKLKHPHHTLASLLDLIADSVKFEGSFFLTDLRSIKAIANAVERYQLPIEVQLTFCFAPISGKYEIEMDTIERFAEAVSKQKTVSLNTVHPMIREQLEALQEEMDTDRTNHHEIKEYETLYVLLDIYIFLSYRLGENVFTSLDLALQLRTLVAERIEHALQLLSKTKKTSKVRRRRARAAREEEEEY